MHVSRDTQSGTDAGKSTEQLARFRLLNDYQRNFPLVPAPFAHIAAEVGMTEAGVLASYRDGLASGTISRIGAVFSSHLGAGTLAAMCVPARRLEEVAALVSAEPAVNHNYEREHAFNLWFVVTAPTPAQRDATIARLERDTGCTTIALPMEEAFHIDLGFDLSPQRLIDANDDRAQTPPQAATRNIPNTTYPPPRIASEAAACALPGIERQLATALQDGLQPEPAPFAILGSRVGVSEALAIEFIERWLADGLIRRFGVIVRHHELGIGANAMCAWDIPDDLADLLGRRLAAEPAVTLCYRRRRAPPHWPYNLFCMIHGRARDEVLAAHNAIATRLGLALWPHAVLFSRRRFKQTGGRWLGHDL